MTDQLSILLNKLNRFIRKYYINQLLKGGIYFVALSVLFFLAINLLEYFAFFSTTFRTILFYLFIAINIFILGKFIIIPLLKIFRIGRTITPEQASLIIGQHFPEIRDKLLNTLQLKQIKDNYASNALIEASIDKRTRELHPVPFLKAIDLGKNKKYLKYALPPVLILILILLVSPKLVTEPSGRIIRYGEYFEKARPYTLSILNDPLEAVQQEDFRLYVKAAGEELPAKIFLSFNQGKYRFSRESAELFYFDFINVQNDIHFILESDEYIFGKYTLKVLPKPIILNFEIQLDYPSYTGKPDETLNNVGDIIIPEGSLARWVLYTRDAMGVHLELNDTMVDIVQESSNVYTYDDRFYESQRYSISVFNQYLKNPDSLTYTINVIPDLYPSISVQEFMDTVNPNILFFSGLIKDDYGFDKLTFSYTYLNNFDSVRLQDRAYSQEIPISASVNQQQFFHSFDLNKLGIVPGDEIAYYFDIWDNDEVNGHKRTRSRRFTFKAPTLQEIEAETEKSNEDIKDELRQTMKDLDILRRQVDKMNEKLVNKESLNWEDKQQIQEMLNQQKELFEKMERIKEDNIQKSIKEQQYKEVNEDLLEKQKQLEELFEELMTDEMKELFEEIQKLLDEVDKNKVSDMLEKMEMNSEEMMKEMDRSLELFKQLEFDKKLTETIEKLEKLAEEQEKASEETSERGSDLEEMQEKQEGLNEEFDDIRKELDELEDLNKELESPNDFIDTDKSEQEIQEEMENSLNSLQENKRRKASESQKNSSQKMQELSDFLMSMQMMMNQQSLTEDIRTLREILENLVQLSFDQEDLMEESLSTSTTDPKYPEVIHEQKKIKDDLRIVEDSLYALSKRQMSIQPFVNKEIESINRNMGQTIELLDERRRSQAASRQQFIMTSINNLALLLSEALNQMQQQLNANSSANCSNPGQGTPKPGQGKGKMSMSELQKQLNKSLEQLKNGMEGKSQQNQAGGQSMSEQLARLAAQQEAIRRQLQQYLNQLKEEGQAGDAGINKLMEEMEKTEEDLVNKMINNETLKRQQDILTRLLQHEKAERQREKEERRESREAKNEIYSNPSEFLEYKRLKSSEAELLKTVPPQLRSFYRNKVTEYFYKFMQN